MTDKEIAYLEGLLDSGKKIAWVIEGFQSVVRIGKRREAWETADEAEPAATLEDGSYVALHASSLSDFVVYQRLEPFQ